MRTFKHSGDLGEIIFGLPTIIALGGGRLYIADGHGNPGINSIRGLPRPIERDTVFQMIELLKTQPCLSDVQPYDNEEVDYNLDKWREIESSHLLWVDHIAEIHLKTFGVRFDLGRPWLENIKPLYKNDIVINRGKRWLSDKNKFNWQSLKGYEDRCVFIGFEKEYEAFVKLTGLNVDRYTIKSLLEFTQIIKGSKLYIGNQSLGSALAEAMKHPMALEIDYNSPRCMPQSLNGHIRLNEKLLKTLLDKRGVACINPAIDNLLAKTRNLVFHLFVEGRILFIGNKIKSVLLKYIPGVSALSRLRKHLSIK